MFKYYNKNVISEIDGSLKIIGRPEGRFCFLKDRDGVLYAGAFTSCEYIATLIRENEVMRGIPLYLNRHFIPCGEENAVRAIIPKWPNFYVSVKYQRPEAYGLPFKECLRYLFRHYSPYTVDKFTAAGEFTKDRYMTLLIHDRRTNAAMCVKFQHGIKLLKICRS